MATSREFSDSIPTVDYQLLRLYIDKIPKIDNNSFELNTYFCSVIGQLNLDNFVYQTILVKLVGKAQILVG